MQMLQPMATVAEVATFLRLSERAVYDHIAAGRIPAVRVGARNLRVDLDELRRALPRVSSTEVEKAP